MTFSKPALVLGGASILLLLLTGCADEETIAPGPAPTSNAVSFTAVSSQEAAQDPGIPSWEDLGENTVRVYLYGSSTCVPTITGASQVNEAVTVELKSYVDEICTADYGPSIWDVHNLPERTATVHVVTPGSDFIETLELIASNPFEEEPVLEEI